MEATRPHLGRDDMEAGFADVARPHVDKKAAVHASVPQWLMDWEDRRPRLLAELSAETLGVFTYVYCGVSATIALYLSIVGKTGPSFGSLEIVGFAYAIGIVLAILISGPVSGGHLSPAFTIAFWVFRGFPGKKVVPYIVAQIFGGFIAAGLVYSIYADQLNAVAAGLRAASEAVVINSTNGPAGQIALFRAAGHSIGSVFLNEFIGCTFLSIIVFTVLDPSNIFVSFSAAPVFIGVAYAVVIWGFAGQGLALNAARDLGARMVAACVYGSAAFSADPMYTAVAALTSIPATLLGAAIQILLLSDSARPLSVTMPDPEGLSMRIISRQVTMGENEKRA